ncbi:MAG: reverse transcriptase family protein [Candidatus Eremiobacterota bacterium]
MEEEKNKIPEDLNLLSPEDFRKKVWSVEGTKFLLSEMIRLGFWPKERTFEDLQPPDETARRRELEHEINSLRAKIGKYGNEEKILKQIRQQMWDESKKKRAEKKLWKEQEKAEKKRLWEEKKEGLILYLGHGVSGGLSDEISDHEKLQNLGLPEISTPVELAKYMGIEISKVRWLTYHRNCTTMSHYHNFTIPKKRGGTRKISSPKPLLRKAQNWIKANILDKILPEPCVHGFIKGKSIMSNATGHIANDIVINMDLKDFFPTIKFKRVKGMFRSFGYSESLSIVLSLLCTEPPRERVSYKGKIYDVSLGDRELPQGACTSPAITNIICRHMDIRLKGKAESLGFNYTRYADDLTFSGNILKHTGKLLNDVTSIVSNEGFEVHPDKTRVFHKSRRQEVTGIVVNKKLSVSREEIKKFRAILHNCEKHGIESQNKEKHPNFIAYLRGYCSYISMVDSEKGKKFREQLDRISGR